MPKFREPIPLQKLAFDTLVASTAAHCDALSIKGLLTQLRQSISVLRQHVSDHATGTMFSEFCRRFLASFYSIGNSRSKKRPDSHHRAALEIMMDVEIVGLTCEGEILRYLDPADAHRIRRLNVLNWRELSYRESVPRELKNFQLDDLTTFIFPRLCTDLDLEIIGSRCSKIRVLRIQESRGVTDRGLRAVHPCSELRIINLHYCRVSDDAVNEFLNVHEKIEQFNIGDYYTFGEESFDILSRPISSVCQSVKRLALKSDPTTDSHIRSALALFPNLTYLRFCCRLTGDPSLLKGFKNLTKLNFAYSSGSFCMKNLKELLMSIGQNITDLNMNLCNPNVSVTQNDLNYIYKLCGNIEDLGFDHKAQKEMDKLVIPPFEKLKILKCIALNDFDGSAVILEFGIMKALEFLTVQNFDAIFEMVESMMLDNVKFPNLREVRTFYNHNEHIPRIRSIIKNNNLDFSFKFQQLV